MKKYLILLLLLIPSLSWGTVVADIDVLPATTVEVGEEVFFSASDTTYDGTAAESYVQLDGGSTHTFTRVDTNDARYLFVGGVRGVSATEAGDIYIGYIYVSAP